MKRGAEGEGRDLSRRRPRQVSGDALCAWLTSHPYIASVVVPLPTNIPVTKNTMTYSLLNTGVILSLPS